jgi:hypothetical protein
MKIISEETFLIDSAIGPVSVTQSAVEEFDIDDYTHSTVISQAVRIQMKLRASNVDTRFTDNRLPVDIEGVQVGGF